jgi:catalase (peroxidase I)
LEVESDSSGRLVVADPESEGDGRVDMEDPSHPTHINIGIPAQAVEAIQATDVSRDSFPFTCTSGDPPEESVVTEETYDSITNDVQASMRRLDDTCTVDSCPRGDWASCVIRLSGHDLLDYSGGLNGTGGADGCIDFSASINMGLATCLQNGEGDPPQWLDTSYRKVCQNVSLADFMVIAAEAAMAEAREAAINVTTSLPIIDFRSSFKYGRNTSTSCSQGAVAAPDPEGSCKQVEGIYVAKLGLSWEEATALSGVHTIGRAHLSHSGYAGFWSSPDIRMQFTNAYFVNMVEYGWVPLKQVAGDPKKNMWIRGDNAAVEQGNLEATGSLGEVGQRQCAIYGKHHIMLN